MVCSKREFTNNKQNELNSSDIISTIPLKTRLDGNQINELVLNDKKSAINAHSYLLTKFARFCNSLYKTGPDILAELKAVPYMDFSQEWTDEKLFDYFDLNEEEIDFINEYIQDWYERDFK